MKRILAVMAAAVLLGGATTGTTPLSSTGLKPEIPAVSDSLIPALHFSSNEPWPEGAKPRAPEGFVVTRFATLDTPRWIYVLPNGDVLVSQARTTRKINPFSRSPNRITLLRDSNGDGKPDLTSVFLSGELDRPFGMVLLGGQFYVADTGSVRVYPYKDGQTKLTGKGRKILDLPVGGYNNHWTRNLVARADGKKIYVTVGSASNAGEHGIGEEKNRAAVLEINPDGSGMRVFASGLRNPNGLDAEPQTGVLWTAVNERDFLGPDLVPDYMTRVRDGDFYGWPWAYWGKHVDARVKPPRPDLVARSQVPDYALGAHVAALGLAFYKADKFPAAYRGGVFIGEHGSWNRKPYVGYKVVFVPFKNGMPDGPPRDFLTGFMPREGVAHGRPVGVTVAKDGALLVADDTGGAVWRVAVKGK